MSAAVKKYSVRLAVLLVWLGVWQAAFVFVGQEILVVSPLMVFRRLVELMGEASFWQSILFTFMRITAGYLLGVIFGTVLAALTCVSSALNAFFAPVLTLARSTPVASFILLALVWIKKDYVPVFIVFLIVLPIIWANVSKGIAETDREYLEVARLYRFGFIKTVRRIYMHTVLPYFAAGCVTALGIGWKSGVSAEVLAMPIFSIGYNLYRAKINIETADLFAWTAAVVLISVILEKLISAALSALRERRK